MMALMQELSGWGLPGKAPLGAMLWPIGGGGCCWGCVAVVGGGGGVMSVTGA